jgi:cytochrome c biogenesis protein CcdA
MRKNMAGYLLVALGIIVIIVVLTADYTGIGNSWGLGWKQIVGTAIGIIIIFAGVWLSARRSNQKLSLCKTIRSWLEI